MYDCVYRCMCAHAHGSQMTISGIALEVQPTISLRQGISLAWSSLERLYWLGGKSKRSTCLCSRMASSHFRAQPCFITGVLGLGLRPPCLFVLSAIEPSPWLLKITENWKEFLFILIISIYIHYGSLTN